MLEFFKKLFGKKKEEVYTPDPPGRTFKRVPTSKHFEGEYASEEKKSIARAKQSKIDKIRDLKLIPMFLRYQYKHKTDEISAVNVVFQKEIFDEREHFIKTGKILHRERLRPIIVDSWERSYGFKVDPYEVNTSSILSEDEYQNKLAEFKLPSSPVFDGMIAANGELFMSLMDGSVICYSGK